MQSLVFLTCFYQKLSKKNLWGGGGVGSTPLVNEGLMKNCRARHNAKFMTSAPVEL